VKPRFVVYVYRTEGYARERVGTYSSLGRAERAVALDARTHNIPSFVLHAYDAAYCEYVSREDGKRVVGGLVASGGGRMWMWSARIEQE